MKPFGETLIFNKKYIQFISFRKNQSFIPKDFGDP